MGNDEPDAANQDGATRRLDRKELGINGRGVTELEDSCLKVRPSSGWNFGLSGVFEAAAGQHSTNIGDHERP